MGSDGIELDVVVEMIVEETGSQSRLERVILSHLLRKPDSTTREIQDAAEEAGLVGGVSLTLHRALDRGELIRMGGPTPRWRIAPGRLPFGAAPGGATVEEVLRVLQSLVPTDWSDAERRAAMQSPHVLRMTAFDQAELTTSLRTVAASDQTKDLWDPWFRAASRIRSASIVT